MRPLRLVFSLLVVATAACPAQDRVLGGVFPPDTSSVLPADSTARDDSTSRGSPSGVDSVVTYAAEDSIVYAPGSRTMFMFGTGELHYKEIGLKAERISVNWNTATLYAEGVADTADTSGSGFRGRPDLVDAGESYHGSSISYNFKSKKGKINVADTKMEGGFYYGSAIKRVDQNVLFVKNGRYTTCDLEHPHYYFGSSEMRVELRDKVVARPVYLYISDVPIFALPFGIFPNERGRRSGLIAPAYGESGTRGRFLQHLGYYWAMSDYTDMSVRADGYTKGSWNISSDFRYKLRYDFDGSISGSLARAVENEKGDPDYADNRLFNLAFRHNQEFNPTTRLTVDFTFTSASGNYYQATSNNFNDLLRQNIISNASLTKSWEGTPNSMAVNIHRDQVIAGPKTGEVSETLPGITFNRTQTFPFRSESSGSGDLSWYDLIGYTYSGQFLNVRSKTKPVDTLDFVRDERWGFGHDVAVNASPKLGYFTFTPFFRYSERWYNSKISRTINPATNSPVDTEEKGFTAVRSYLMGVSTSTKLYGVFQPGIFGIKGIRHQIIPSLTYSYQPDFAKPGYGYYGTYTDTLGREIRYNKFERGVLGGAPAGESQAISMRIGNIFEMKTASTDSAGEDNKFQLLNADITAGYNFARDSLNFDEIGLSYRTAIGQLLSIGGGARFNLYKFEGDPANPLGGGRVNKFLWNEEGRLAELTSFNISVTTRLSGEKQKTSVGPVVTEEDSIRKAGGYRNLYDEDQPDFSIPWQLDLSWIYSQTQNNPRVKIRSSNLSLGLNFNLTEFWKITASASYDLVNKQVAAPTISVYRDLHCWEMNFSWVPTGFNRNYRFEIRLKAPQLQDVKVTKQESSRI